MIRPQLILDVHDELIVDNFAGGGGASTGIELALGRHVDHAINHDRLALGMHRINHPQTVHHTEDIFDVDPATICEGRPVGLAHFSPDCKHFSKAKGGKPLDKRIRGLALVMLRWAKYGARVMTMENVEEIRTWGPLKKIRKNGKVDWYPDPDHRGRTWLAFLACLGEGIRSDHPDLPEILEVLAGTVTRDECVRGFGYRVEARELKACEYGSPTIRKRLFLIARNDCKPIVWPETTHFDPTASVSRKGKKPWRTIAECIDWDRPCPSIFLTRDEAKKARCKRPLARATLRRAAKGIDRYVLKAAKPFLVSLTHQGGDRVESVDAPANTITGAHRGEKAIVAPVLTEHANANKTAPYWPVDEPLRTQCAEVKGGHFALMAGSLVQTGYGEREGQSPRALDPNEPLGTVVAGGGKHAVVTGALVGAGGPARSGEPRPFDAPVSAQTTKQHKAIASATLVHTAHGDQDSKGKKRGRGAHDVTEPMPSVLASPDGAVFAATLVGAGGRAAQSRPRGADEPMHTTTAKGDTCIAAASMVKLRGDNIGDSAEKPVHTVSAGGTHHAVVAASLVVNTSGHPGASPEEPLKTVTTGGHHAVVAASLTRHFGTSVGGPVDQPSPTVMGRAKDGLVAAHLTKFNTGAVGSEMTQPAPTITAGSHSPETHGGAAAPQGVVAASLTAYYGQDAEPGQRADEPSRTVTAKARMGLVESHAVAPMTEAQIAGAHRVAAFLREHGVQFEGEFATVAGYVIVDIGMRMLTPRELFRAQGFGNHYIIDRAWVVDPQTGEVVQVTLTKEQQIRMCGNSVCPQVEAALIRANVPELAVRFPGEKAVLA